MKRILNKILCNLWECQFYERSTITDARVTPNIIYEFIGEFDFCKHCGARKHEDIKTHQV